MSVGLVVRRAVRGATALRGGRTWRPTPYQVFGFLFFLVMTLAYWRVPLCCGAGQHAAVVERLRVNLLHPAHPTADLPGAGSPYYSPYAVIEGAFARLTGLTGWAVVRLAGPLNLLVLLTGLGRLVRVLTPRPWAPVLALLATTLLTGTGRAGWSGSLGLMPLTGSLGHPSTCAVGLTLWAWALTGSRARGSGLVRYVGPSGLSSAAGYAGLGALYGLILLIDPVTSLAAALGALAFVAGWQREWRAAVTGRWALACAVALLVAACWPYFDAFAPIAGDGGRPYEGLPGRVWPALVGLPALWARARRARRDPLVLLCASACLALAYGWARGLDAYGGILGLTLVAPQLALAVESAAPRPWSAWRRALGWVAAAVACAAFLTVHAGAVVPRALDPVGFGQPPRPPSYDWAARYLRPGEAVVADGYASVRLIPGYGADLVAPVLPDRALAEGERLRRLAAVHRYLDPASTRAERTTVARRYHVRWLLLTRRRRVPEEATVVAWSRATGEVLARVDGSGRTTR